MGFFENVRVQKLIAAATELVGALTKEAELRTALMVADLSEVTSKQIELEKEQEKQSQGQGMMKYPFGFCPTCKEEGTVRSRTGTDKCRNGHVYSSEDALSISDVERSLQIDKKKE